MIVALLVLIVLILLFGAPAVKGWIVNAAVGGCGFIAICLALVWVETGRAHSFPSSRPAPTVAQVRPANGAEAR